MNNAERVMPKAGTYILLVGKEAEKADLNKAKAFQSVEGLESAARYLALTTHLKTGKAVKLIEIRMTGENSCEALGIIFERKAGR